MDELLKVAIQGTAACGALFILLKILQVVQKMLEKKQANNNAEDAGRKGVYIAANSQVFKDLADLETELQMLTDTFKLNVENTARLVNLAEKTVDRLGRIDANLTRGMDKAISQENIASMERRLTDKIEKTK